MPIRLNRLDQVNNNNVPRYKIKNSPPKLPGPSHSKWSHENEISPDLSMGFSKTEDLDHTFVR